MTEHKVLGDRIDGKLAVSRAFGDFVFKDQESVPASEQAVTAKPDVFEY